MREERGVALIGSRCTIEPGSGNYHLRLAGCDDCDARHLARMTLEQVEGLYHDGYVRQAMFEAFMYVWATGAPRFSSLGDNWRDAPADPEVSALVARFREEAERREQLFA